MRRILWLAGCAAILAMGGLLPGCQQNPLTGEKNLMLLSPEEEVQLGREAAPEFEKEYGGRLQDDVLQNYVRTVGLKAAAQAAKAAETGYPYEYTFAVLQSDVVNAFALPGGPVYVTRGLLLKMDDESQLAAVLAHEVTHVAARHSAQQMSRSLGASFMLNLGVFLTSGGKSSETPTTTTTGSSKVETIAKVILALRDLQYSRKDETQADLYGVDFMTRAGWQPLGMVHLMQMFVAEEAASGGGTIEFLRTHPNPKNRVADIQDKMNKDYPAASSDPRLAVGRDAYQKNVISRLSAKK